VLRRPIECTRVTGHVRCNTIQCVDLPRFHRTVELRYHYLLIQLGLIPSGHFADRLADADYPLLRGNRKAMDSDSKRPGRAYPRVEELCADSFVASTTSTAISACGLFDPRESRHLLGVFFLAN
jgi:hypothetical protein